MLKEELIDKLFLKNKENSNPNNAGVAVISSLQS
jgi:hypothetical protein